MILCFLSFIYHSFHLLSKYSTRSIIIERRGGGGQSLKMPICLFFFLNFEFHTYKVTEVGIAQGCRIGHDRTRVVRLVVVEQRHFRDVPGQHVVDVFLFQRPKFFHAGIHIASPVVSDVARRLRPVRDVVRVIGFWGPVTTALLHDHLPQTGDDFIFEIEQSETRRNGSLKRSTFSGFRQIFEKLGEPRPGCTSWPNEFCSCLRKLAFCYGFIDKNVSVVLTPYKTGKREMLK